MLDFEFTACNEDAERLEAYVATAALFGDELPPDVLDELCDECKGNIEDAMRDGAY